MNHTHEMTGTVAVTTVRASNEPDDPEAKAPLPDGWAWVDGKTARHPYLGEVHRLPAGWFAYPPHARTQGPFGDFGEAESELRDAKYLPPRPPAHPLLGPTALMLFICAALCGMLLLGFWIGRLDAYHQSIAIIALVVASIALTQALVYVSPWLGFGPALIALIGVFAAAAMRSVSLSQFAVGTAIACGVVGTGWLLFTAILSRRDISAWRTHRELLSVKTAARLHR